MTLAALDMLGSVITPLPIHSGRLHTLALHDAGTGLGLPPKRHPQVVAHTAVYLFPHGLFTPAPKVMIDGFPLREIVEEEPPLAAGPQHVENRIQDITPWVRARSP